MHHASVQSANAPAQVRRAGATTAFPSVEISPVSPANMSSDCTRHLCQAVDLPRFTLLFLSLSFTMFTRHEHQNLSLARDGLTRAECHTPSRLVVVATEAYISGSSLKDSCIIL